MYFLIGHRGVGKTTAIKSVQGAFDLDAEISKNHNIFEMLSKGEEKKFREIEIKTLFELLRTSNPKIVALGAGFELEKFQFPEGAKFIWLQRKSDQVGRIFFNRPKLDVKKKSIDEFLDRKETRDKMYQKFADFKIESEEGASSTEVIDKFLNKKLFMSRHGFYTLQKKVELEFLSAYSLTGVELRTDYFTEAETIEILSSEKKRKFVVALRKLPSEEFVDCLLEKQSESSVESAKILVDIPSDYTSKGFLEKFNKNTVYISEHDFMSLEEIKRFNKMGYHIKWAPEVESFDELVEFHHAVKNLDVSFLPRSVGEPDGRWNWYRQLTFKRNKITFFRYGLNDYMDQPSHYELEGCQLQGVDGERGLHGAVLGSDVGLSHSPSYHRSFFMKNFKGTYFTISLYKDEFSQENLAFLKSMGIKFISVTSPFKDELGALSQKKGPQNTLYLGDKYKTTDTDMEAVISLKGQLSSYSDVLVWGAGAMGKAIFESLGGKSTLQSVRDYSQKNLIFEKDFDAVVWCAGSDCLVSPKLSVPPRSIFDIEYKEHSRAKAVALSWGCEYISGAAFFKTQAKAQQEFWKACVKGHV